MNTAFTKLLLQWHVQENKRLMPWKGEKDPYKIWLSEIILQQTRVEQGWNYYEKFIQTYPTIHHLAKAKDEAVFKLWEGLGYYNRCKNLLFTARFISTTLKGQFPNNYEALLNLKGVGPYTAAAIGSFAFNLPYAVVDGNVFRVLSRFFGIETPIDSTDGKKLFTALANKVLDTKQPGQFNQAIMDFGATVCKPALPVCNTCPLQKKCVSYKNAVVNQLPVKTKTLLKKRRWLYYFLFEVDGKLMVHKREQKDIWQNLYEFYLLECDEQNFWNKELVMKWLKQQFNISKADVQHISPLFKQQLTHQLIQGQFILVKLNAIPASLKSWQWHNKNKLNQLSFPRFIHQFLETQVVNK